MTEIILTIHQDDRKFATNAIVSKKIMHYAAKTTFKIISKKTKTNFRSVYIDLEIVTAEESQRQNEIYFKKQRPTNVISIQTLKLDGKIGIYKLYGTISLCPTVILKEISEAEIKISFMARALHLFVHGLLHIIGLDHETEEDAQYMEDLESSCLYSIFGKSVDLI